MAWSRLARMLVWASGSLLAGCLPFIGDKDDAAVDYQTAQVTAPLQVPEELDGSSIGDLMAIPPLREDGRRLPSKFKVPKPNVFGGTPTDPVKIQRFSGQSWIVIAEPPETTWPKVKQFLADNGMAVERDVPAEGLLESDVISVSSALSYRDVIRSAIADTGQLDGEVSRLMLRVEHGLRQFTSEIHVRLATGLFDRSWPETSSYSESEAAVLQQLGAYLAADVGHVAVSKVAQDIGTLPKAVITEDDSGQTVLRLRLDFSRAWAVLGQALDAASVEIENRDADARTLDVRVPADKLPRSSRRLIGRITPFTGGSHGLLLKMVEAEDGFDVMVFSAEDEQRTSNEVSEAVFALVQEFIG